ncbi:hypothetical protein GOP47_0006546 [Adiantum capillus-veneris]|uniref:C3H1-type domain-containing protein n=1 Tax=Adiantum capillus-veneris TaxID=13818 RepID=A0A9D4V3M8_ADICA|nr:hypothetical protein GOP47_0006546 [Adiantum capillus-veneris]
MAGAEEQGSPTTLRSPKRPKLHHSQNDRERHSHAQQGVEEQSISAYDVKGDLTLAAPPELPPVSPSLPHIPQQQIKCRLFSTRHGCAFGNSCFFLHSSEDDHRVPFDMSKATACTKYFSTAGCPYGDSCLFSHYVPASVASLATSRFAKSGVVEKQLGGPNAESTVPKTRTLIGEHKSQLCNQFGTLKGCQYGDRCHFAHGEHELHRLENDKDCDLCVAKSLGLKPSNDNAPCNFGNSRKLTFGIKSQEEAGLGAPFSKTSAVAFGSSSKTLVDIDANLVGPIIGRKGKHAKQICRLTGAKLCIRKHETDPNLRVLEMEGSFEQVKRAGKLVKEVLIYTLPKKPCIVPHHRKSKVCDNFPLGKCAFGSKCHFVHAMAGKTSAAES